jgi:hypothetical protein
MPAMLSNFLDSLRAICSDTAFREIDASVRMIRLKVEELLKRSAGLRR